MERGPTHRGTQELMELLLNNNHLLSFSPKSIPFELNKDHTKLDHLLTTRKLRNSKISQYIQDSDVSGSAFKATPHSQCH